MHDFGSLCARLTRQRPFDAVRRRFLRETESSLSKEGSLAPFQLAPFPTKSKNTHSEVLKGQELVEGVDMIRTEVKRVGKALRSLNCSFRRGTKAALMSSEDRDQEFMSMQRDLKELTHTANKVVDSLGTDGDDAGPRYDFVRANKRMLHLSDPRVKAAKAVRQSVVKMEKTERCVGALSP